MRILALDCGRQTGWATWHNGRVAHGTWDFALDYGWSAEAAGWSLQQRVADHITQYRPDAVAIERPFGRNAAAMVEAAQMAMVAAVVVFARDMRPMWLSPSTVRKAFVGNGKAKKAAVMDECLTRGFSPASDHEGDAIAMVFTALERAGGEAKAA